MKKIILLLITLCLFTGSMCYVNAMCSKLIGKVIVIDVGHGGKDSGTVYNNVKEKDLNLAIALKLQKELIKNGVEVIMVREGDYDLSYPGAMRRKKSDFDNRIELINNSSADMYLSIHINYLDNSKYYGAQVFYTEDNKKIADSIQNVFNEDLKSPLKSRKLGDDIYMYKKLDVPGVLIECGFLSNYLERNKLQDDRYQDKIVDCIIKGLINFY